MLHKTLSFLLLFSLLGCSGSDQEITITCTIDGSLHEHIDFTEISSTKLERSVHTFKFLKAYAETGEQIQDLSANQGDMKNNLNRKWVWVAEGSYFGGRVEPKLIRFRNKEGSESIENNSITVTEQSLIVSYYISAKLVDLETWNDYRFNIDRVSGVIKGSSIIGQRNRLEGGRISRADLQGNCQKGIQKF